MGFLFSLFLLAANPCAKALSIIEKPNDFIRSLHIESENLLVRGVSREDIPALHRIISLPEVRRYFFYGTQMLKHIDPKDFDVILEYLVQEGIVSIIDRKTDKVIGFADLWDFSLLEQEKVPSVELGLAIDPDFAGRGIATESLESMLRHLFHDLGFRQIVGNARSSNDRSIKMITRTGYKYDSEVQPTIRTSDEYIASRLKGTALEGISNMSGYDPAFVWTPDPSSYRVYTLQALDFLPRIFRPLVGEKFFDRDWTQASVSELIELTSSEKEALLSKYPRLSQGVREMIGQMSSNEFTLGFFRRNKLSSDEVVLAGTLHDSLQSSVGLWMITLNLAQNESFLDYVKIDRSKEKVGGRFKQWFNAYTKLLQVTGVETDRLSAEWTGRIVWAKMGYDIDPTRYYTIDGVQTEQLQGIAENFGRFLQRQGLSFADLELDGGNGTRTRLVPEDLRNISNYIMIKHRDGKKVRLTPYIDYLRFGAEEIDLDVGEAFSIGFYGHKEDDSINFRSPGGYRVSSFFMPGWRGVRKIKK